MNQQVVHDATAYLFWTQAEKDGVQQTNDEIRQTAGKSLLKQSFALQVLNQFGYEQLDEGSRQIFAAEVALEAERFALEESNLLGVIYSEDANGGRSPSAKNVDVSSVNMVPKHVTCSSKVERIGHLCLRHPLPAVVFSSTDPRGEIFEIADTRTALGFQLPMYMVQVNSQRIGDDLYVSNGVLNIPVPDAALGVRWNSVIQNSTRFVSGLTIFNAKDTIEVEVQW